MSTRNRPARFAAVPAVSVGAALVLATLASSALGAPGAAGADRASSHHSAPFVLDDQTEWVVPPAQNATGGPAPSAPFDLGLTVSDAPSGAAVEAVLYPRLRSRFAFETAVRRSPRGGPLSETSPVPLRGLPPDPHAAGGVSWDLSVVQATSSGQGSQLGLGCGSATGAGTCTGVYPVVVELERSDGSVAHRFTTFLTYVAGKSAHPLDLAWVVPVEAPVSISTDAKGAGQAIRPLSATDASALEALVAELRGSPVPVTLDASPETLQALGHAGANGRAADAALAAMSANRSTDEVLASPYVPVDLGALAGAGEPTEITAQMAAGATILERHHVKTTASPSVWVQTGPVGNDIAGGLARVGATQLVLSDADLAATSNVTNTGTWASTFELSLAHGGSTAPVEAAETDTYLDDQFTAEHGDPALAATQLLADLAMVHFERPNTTAVRGMVAVPPSSWSADPVFDRVLLDGLAQSPVVKPVTLSQFFTSVTVDGSRQLRTSGTGPVLGHALAASLSRARVRLSEFDDAVVGHPTVVSQLDDLLLASESESFSEKRQAAGVASVLRLLTRQLDLVSFSTVHTFTLTARTGSIPITVESRATYTVRGTLSVSGNKFTFPHHGTRRAMRLDHATNTLHPPLFVLARTSGDLPLHVEFSSPDGSLVFARDTLTVRSTATSVVGIVLTVVALVVLFTWWARTWWSGRRRRLRRRAAPESGSTAS